MGHFRRSAFLLLAAATLLRPQDRPRLLIVDIDGIRRDTFENTYSQGRLPNFERLLRPAVWYDRAAGVIPTVTMASQSSIFTGVPPERHGIPGNAWFSRPEAKLYEYTSPNLAPCLFAFTLLGGAECSGGLLNRHLLARTLYEAASENGLRSVVSFHPLWRGATRALVPSLADGLAWISSGGVDFEAFDRTMAARAAEVIATEGVPDILTLYFAGADEIGHSHGIASQPPYLERVVDPELGRVVRAIETREPSWRSYSMVVVTADHGRTDAEANPEDRTLARDLLAAVARSGFAADDVRLAVNGGMAYVYLKSGDDWEFPPSPERVAAVEREIRADPILDRTVERVEVRQQGRSERWGDLSVFLQRGHYFGNTGVGSHHGNLDELDLAVPLVVARPGWPAGHTDAEACITRVAGTAAAFLGFEMEGAEPPLPGPARARDARKAAGGTRNTPWWPHLLR